MSSKSNGSPGKLHPAGIAQSSNSGSGSYGKKRKAGSRTGSMTNNLRRDAASAFLSSEQLHAATAAGTMSFVDATDYMGLHQGYVNRMSSSSSSSDVGGTAGGAKVSFGPSRPPSESGGTGGRSITINGASMSAAATIAAAMGATSVTAGSGATASTSSINFGDLDLEALKERAAAVASGETAFRNKQGLPCTEAEMKALMGMFVEIMGMSVGGSGGHGGTTTSGTATASTRGSAAAAVGGMGNAKADFYAAASKAGPLFSFGTHPGILNGGADDVSPMTAEQMAAATAGFFADGASWEALRRTYAAAEQMVATEEYDEDDDDEDEEADDESFDNRELTFEEVEFLLHHRKQKEEAAKLGFQFTSGDWESLEQVAINDQFLESDDKERKAAKKREKKQRRKAKQKDEAAQKAAEAAHKKREKTIVSWRSRVLSACQSNETAKLEGLLQESPLRSLQEETANEWENHPISPFTPHLEFLLPNTLAKNRAHVERGVEARLRLAEYILETELALGFKPLRTGRAALHSACFHGDLQFVLLLLDKLESHRPAEGEEAIPRNVLDATCGESGWSPLHYAAVSGSSEVLELLLERGCNASTLTDVRHTWKKGDGRGITPRELVHYVQSEKYEKAIETHGLAMQEMANTFLAHHQERRVFLRQLESVYSRLAHIEKNGYSSKSVDLGDIVADAEPSSQEAAAVETEESATRNRKKKKKKKKGANETDSDVAPMSSTPNVENLTPKTDEAIPAEIEPDPLVTALLGMGFNESQIEAAVKACGGTDHATADDLVTWILGQCEVENIENDATNEGSERQLSIDSESPSHGISSERIRHLTDQEKTAEASAARQQEEAARRLAAKREEARRRNREWNSREQARQQRESAAKIAQKTSSVPRSTHSPSDSMRPPFSKALPLPSATHAAASSVAPRFPAGIAVSRLSENVTQPPVRGLGVAPDMATLPKWNVPRQMPVTSANTFASPQLSSRDTTPPLAGVVAQPSQVPSSSFPPINDDERTVSSFGSNRGLSVSSREFLPASFGPPPSNSFPIAPSVPPPGFMSTNSQAMAIPLRHPVPTVPENSSSVVFSEQVQQSQGEIRATAKAFFPTGFGQVPSEGLPALGGFVPSKANKTAAQPPGVGLPREMIAQNTSSVVPMPLRGASFMPSSFERVPSVTPVSFDSTVPGSSLVGVGTLEEPPLGAPLAFGVSGSKSNLIGGLPVLNSISRSGSVGASSIWGESQRIPSLGSSLQPSFFEDANVETGGSGELHGTSERNTSWGSIGENPSLPSCGQGSIW